MTVKKLIHYYEALLKETSIFIAISTRTFIEFTIGALRKLPEDEEIVLPKEEVKP